MRILPLIVALLLLAFPCAAEEPVEIPLDQIWADDMPGTRPINQIAGKPSTYEDSDRPLLAEIQTVLTNDRKRSAAGKGFAVPGGGLEALREAHAVLVKGKAKRKTFRKNERISLVFFSHEFGYYVHLEGVEQQSNIIQITYRFVPHLTKELTHHLALIPITLRRTGEIRVEVIEGKSQLFVGMDASKFRSRIPKIVCRSFIIEVVEE